MANARESLQKLHEIEVDAAGNTEVMRASRTTAKALNLHDAIGQDVFERVANG